MAKAALLTPVRRFVLVHATALLPALLAGLIGFGWRAGIALALVWAGAMLGFVAWRRVGRRGNLLDAVHLTWLSLLLVAMLPAHWGSSGLPTAEGPVAAFTWSAALGAGVLLSAAAWLLGGGAGGRILPSLAVYLVLAGTVGTALEPRLSLVRESALTGDVLDYDRRPLEDLSPIPWVSREADFGVDARYRVPAAQVLSAFTDPSVTTPDRRELTMASVLRERMPPMEDLIVLGHPRPIGMASVAALVAGGLFLFYRGVGDVRIAILAILAAYGTFALVPVPASINADGAKWTVGLGLIGDWPAAMFPWLASRPQVEWDVALTFIHYELLSGPILFLALYLAPLPSLRPLATKWRLIYAIAIGCAMAVAQRYLGPTWGPHAALVALGAMTPLLDRLTRARPLL